MFLELLYNRELLFCISIVKFEDKSSKNKVMDHVVNMDVFSSGGHIFHQLDTFMHNGLNIGGHLLPFYLMEYHELVATYVIVTGWAATVLRKQFYHLVHYYEVVIGISLICCCIEK